MTENISVFFASDDNYAPYLTSAIYSILDNTKEKIDFYILDGGIKNETKQKIEDSLKDFGNYSLHYVDMTKFSLERFPDCRFSASSYSRYFIPEIAPDLKKALYLDADIIVSGDIAELYHQDLEDYPLGAVTEDFMKAHHDIFCSKIWPDFQGGDNYFNSGVLLMNIPEMKKYTQELVEKTIALGPKLICPDQDILNIVFDKNFKKLDYRYNYFPDVFELYQASKGYKASDNIRRTALVTHYIGLKPWKNMTAASDLYWKYAQRTVFGEELKKKYAQRRIGKGKICILGIPLIKIEFFANKQVYRFCRIPVLTKKFRMRENTSSCG